jgi:hypothetical protein
MEFFRCDCPDRGDVIFDGSSQGPNRDGAGNLLTKQCNTGLHVIRLTCPADKRCVPEQVEVEIKDTDPISPMELTFQCAG